MTTRNLSGRGAILIEAGVVLFLIGLLIGLAVPVLENPRMGLSSHLEAVFNGMFLVLVGLIWSRIQLSGRVERILFGLLLFGTFANMMATLFAAVWGAGRMMPIAANGMEGSAWQEGVIGALLVSLSLAMISAAVLIIAGLRKGRKAAI